MGGKSSSPDLQGELHCSIEVLPHDYLHLNEDGVLEVNALVSIWRWIAGGEVVVPLLDGSRVVRFPSMAH
jgi:DnaJ-class molecular chaperone